MEAELWDVLERWITTEHDGAVINVEWKTVPGECRVRLPDGVDAIQVLGAVSS
jgi:hypothetical protein